MEVETDYLRLDSSELLKELMEVVEEINWNHHEPSEDDALTEQWETLFNYQHKLKVEILKRMDR